MNKVDLIIIDPQISFCDPQKGELYVQGAEKDMTRLAAMIDRIGKKISKIHTTLDSHHMLDVAHPIFWKNSQGENPDPFTIISVEDIKNGVWLPVFPSYTQRMIDYTQSLSDGGRYPLCIWPPHCLIGSTGHGVYPVLYDAITKWETEKPWIVNYVSKGSNIFTEHFSAVKAEVPDPTDPSTQLNTKLIETLMEADIIAVAGEAGSHCLANTIRDIVNELKDESYVQKIVLLEDATSPVTGFEQLQEDFITEMKAKGMQISNTLDFLA